MMNYYNFDIEEVLTKLETNENGLNDEEVKNRLQKYGKNKLIITNKQSKIKKFLCQFKDIMIIILILSAIVSFILSIINNESFTDSIIILLIVIINAIVGYIQELKADKALEELKKLQTTKTKVKREGKIIEIDSENIVIGDILVLEAGDTVPADARIIYEASLKCDESSLTGESTNVSKTSSKLDGELPLQNRTNMIYSGTNITYGKCIAVVTSTGNDTEFGLIAKTLTEEIKEVTPLERKINDISKFLSIIIFVIIFIMFIIGLIKGMKISEVIMLSISLAVAAIPEGLPAVITITLSLGVATMSKKKAIVRKLSSVETLGCTEVICSDKTGTITQNKMTVVGIYFDNKLIDSKEEINNDLLEMMALNNDVEKSDDKYIGDSTEIALYNICEDHLIDVNDLRSKILRIGELPFDSDRKMMSTINRYDKCIKILTKGSFDSIINCCTKIYENGNISDLGDSKKQELKNKEKELSNKAYRILAFAFKEISDEYNLDINLENNLIFVGMTLMIDPPRLDVKEAINECKLANIKPIMITGDSLDTAIAISKEIGILSNRKEAITGTEIDKLSKQELKDKVKEYSVYARVSPMNKLEIVNAWKENDVVVAMTGDGVNDAPALKKADIGIGMGITGTEVSKNVSDIILADDSFSTIVTAVEEGRRIYDNIRNVLVYLITGNIAEVLVVFIGMIFGIEIFLPIQLLYINLITDSIPAIALSFEEGTNDIMERKVKNTNTFFTPFLLSKIFLSSLLKTSVILFVYFTSVNLYGVSISISMTFLCLILLEMIFAFTCRNLKKNIIFEGMFKNKVMNKSMIILLLIQILLFITPLKSMFGIVRLSLFQLIYCIIIVLTIFLIDELTKTILVKLFKD